MTLSESDGKLFYQLWFPLLDFVNEKCHVSDEVGKMEGAEGLDTNEVKKVANRLWDEPALIDEYLALEKTQSLPEDQRAILASWKNCLTDTFVLERLLKKGGIFINQSETEAYQVRGIISDWDEIMPFVPIMVKATLIPWRDGIITDGLVNAYSIYLGPGIKKNLKDAYRQIKAEGRLHTSLIEEPESEITGGDATSSAKKSGAAAKKAGKTKKSSAGVTQRTKGKRNVRYTLKVYPKGRAREAYRTLEIAGTESLDDLCREILMAFDFDNDHMYEFCMDNKMYSYGLHYSCSPEYYGEKSTKCTINSIGLRKGQNFLFHYDFGDDWGFTVHVQKIVEDVPYYPAEVIAAKGTVEQYPDWDEEEWDEEEWEDGGDEE